MQQPTSNNKLYDNDESLLTNDTMDGLVASEMADRGPKSMTPGRGTGDDASLASGGVADEDEDDVDFDDEDDDLGDDIEIDEVDADKVDDAALVEDVDLDDDDLDDLDIDDEDDDEEDLDGRV